MSKEDGKPDDRYQKILGKYGYQFDMALLLKPYEKVDMNIVEKVFRGIIQRGNLRVRKHMDVEEFTKSARIVYQKRFGRAKKKIIIDHFGELYANTLKNAHRAFLVDRPDINEDHVEVEVDASLSEAESLSNPFCLMIQKVKVSDKITAIKVVYNSMIHRAIWPDMMDINLAMAGILSQVLRCECVYGRTTSLSIRAELCAHISNGQSKEIIAEKSALEDTLKEYNLSVNQVLDTVDIEIATLHAFRELLMIQETLGQICEATGTKHAQRELVRFIEEKVLPAARDERTMPSLRMLAKLARDFIKDKSTKLNDIIGFTEEGVSSAKRDELNSVSVALSQCLSGYIMYVSLINRQAFAEVLFLQLEYVDPKDHKDAMR